MIFDTDVLIFVQRGNSRAAKLIDRQPQRCVSVQTYMELLQNARDRSQHQFVMRFLKDFGFSILPFTENIGYRASIYVEEYGLSHNIRAGDAIIAATAVEHALPLSSANAKHSRSIRELDLRVFRP